MDERPRGIEGLIEKWRWYNPHPSTPISETQQRCANELEAELARLKTPPVDDAAMRQIFAAITCEGCKAGLPSAKPSERHEIWHHEKGFSNHWTTECTSRADELMAEFATLRLDLACKREEIERQLSRYASIEGKAHLQTIDERDAAEEALSQAYFLIKGESPNWSNNFGHDQALEDIDDAQKCLRAEIAQLTLDNEHLNRLQGKLNDACAEYKKEALTARQLGAEAEREAWKRDLDLLVEKWNQDLKRLDGRAEECPAVIDLIAMANVTRKECAAKLESAIRARSTSDGREEKNDVRK